MNQHYPETAIDLTLPTTTQEREDLILAGDNPALWKIEAAEIVAYSLGHRRTSLTNILSGNEKSIYYYRMIYRGRMLASMD